MIDFDILWRFVFEAGNQAKAQAAADEVAALLALQGLPPVAAYKEEGWWMTDIVVGATETSLAVLFGRQLALAGKLSNEWSVHVLSELAEDGTCYALFNAGERNRPLVAGLHWALLELWVRQDPTELEVFLRELDEREEQADEPE